MLKEALNTENTFFSFALCKHVSEKKLEKCLISSLWSYLDTNIVRSSLDSFRLVNFSSDGFA